MYPILFKIYGPLAIHSYSLAIITGLIVMVYYAAKDKLTQKYVKFDQILSIISGSVISAIIGGRILHIISEWKTYQNNLWDMFAIWNGGLSSLGAVIAMVIYFPIILTIYKLPILPISDIAGIYVPLFQSIARLGCLFAGCCFGKFTNKFWGITYTNPECFAPLNIKLHPTQLYSSISFFIIFLIIYFISRNYYRNYGQLITTYMFLMSLERFMVDFYRGDRNLGYKLLNFSIDLSIDQIIALIILIISTIFLIYFILKPKNEHIQLH